MDPRTLKLADLILCIFETSSKLPKYSTVATLRDGPGGVKQITWGYHQGTDASNTVDEILEEFVKIVREKSYTYGPAIDMAILRDWVLDILPKFRSNNPTVMQRLANDNKVKVQLGVIGALPEGQEAQRTVFRRKYMMPAIAAVEGSGWVDPISLVTVLDGMTHGSWARLRDLTSPQLKVERNWIKAYLLRRNKWLRNAHEPLPATACRSEALLKLMAEGNYNLTTPFVLDLGKVRGKFTITEADLGVF